MSIHLSRGGWDVEKFCRFKEQYRFSNLQSTPSGITSCEGVKVYPIGEHIGRVCLGVLITLATGSMGLLSLYVRSLFHREHRIFVTHDPQDTFWKMYLDEGQVWFVCKM